MNLQEFRQRLEQIRQDEVRLIGTCEAQATILGELQQRVKILEDALSAAGLYLEAGNVIRAHKVICETLGVKTHLLHEEESL